MYEYVTDKAFLRESYCLCADLVNQLKQRLEAQDIHVMVTTVGSKKRGLVTQNANEDIDYDFNLWLLSAEDYLDGKRIKDTIKQTFDAVLHDNGFKNNHCEDSTSAITTKPFHLKKGNQTGFKIDLCIVKEDRYGYWNRLIHQKTGNVLLDNWIWNRGPNGSEIEKKEKFLKTRPEYWNETREEYLRIKNMYLERNDHDHPSFKCYIEAVNHIYDKYYISLVKTEY